MSVVAARTALTRLAPRNEARGRDRTVHSPSFPEGGHAGLLLDRYLLERDDSNETLKALHAWVQEAAPPPLYRDAFARWEATLAALAGRDGTIGRAIFTTGHGRGGSPAFGRMIVGLGAESVRETAISLHRAWGVPMIPGSALKGLARRYLEKHLSNDLDTMSTYRDVLFGSTASAGYVTYFDAWYVPGSAPGDRPLALDTITVHHPRYYNAEPGNRREPWDFDDPTPISFLSARGSYLVAVRGPDARWTDAVLDVLTAALADWGVGAKTSSGYGRLRALPDTRTPRPISAATPTQTTAASSQPSPDTAGSSVAAASEPPAPVPQGGHTAAEAIGTTTQPARTKAEETAPADATEASPPSLAQRIAAVPDGYQLNERLAALAEEAARLPAGPERDAASRAIVQRLRQAGTWEQRRTQSRPWVQTIIRYLNSRRGRSS